MKRAVFAILFAAGLTACNQDATAPVQVSEAPLAAASASVNLDQPFVLRVGRSATVAGEGLTVSFQAVPSDSRCPTGVQCVWAGNAVVQVVLSKDGKAFGAELNTSLEPTSVDYLDYNVALVSLDPYPTAGGGAIRQSQYRATFVVTRTAP
jgi:hypothetical protein